MEPVPLFGTGTGTKSSNVSAQSRTNLYVERYQDPDKGPLALFARPGLTRYPISGISGSQTSGGATKPGVILGPIRGMAANWVPGTAGYSSIYGVIGNVTFQILGAGTFFYNSANYLTSSVLTTSSGRVSLVNDGINIAVADGVAGYYAPAGTPSQMQPIPSANFPVTTGSMCVVASHVVAADPVAVGRFRWSAAGDVTTWNALDFATAESCPDPLTCVFESNGELLLFGVQTLEFWSPTTDSAVFARIGSSGAQWGTDAVDTVRQVGNRCMFLGRQQVGTYSVVLLNGYTPQVVSTSEIDADIQATTGATSATANVVTWLGHTFYVLNLPTKSWAYDITTGVWALWSTDGGRFAGQYQCQFNQSSILSDYRDGRLYYLDSVYTDDLNVMVREVTSRHTFANLGRLRCRQVVIDAETGVGLTSGQGVDPQIMLTISKDGGHTWGNELWLTIGAMGKYITRLVWRRLGVARDWLFKLRVTDPVKVVIIGAAGDFDG